MIQENNNKKTILILEDDRDLCEGICLSLNSKEFSFVSCQTIVEARKQWNLGCFDLLILDINLSDGSGLEFLREVRRSSKVPVALLTAKDMELDIVAGLECGADDYITKPFDLGEVTARVISNLRRYHIKNQKKQLSYKELTLDTESKTLIINDTELELTAKEYGIMELLLQSPNKVFSKAYLYETIWGYEYLGDKNVIKTHISNLRTKMKNYSETEYIETVWGLGYRLAK